MKETKKTRQPTEEEKLFENDISGKVLITKMYKELIQSNTEETKNLIKMGRGPECFFKDIQMAKRHMNTHSLSLITREMQIKTTIRYHFIPVRMAIIKKTRNNKFWQECAEKGALTHH